MNVMTWPRFLLPAALVLVPAAGHADDSEILQSFDARGIERVVLRAANAEQAQVVKAETAQVTIKGRAEGGAAGYHSPDPGWKETPASQWGMKFVGKRFGPVFVVSSQNEIQYIHHGYVIERITIALPKGVLLTRETRPPTGSGEPDLRAP